MSLSTNAARKGIEDEYNNKKITQNLVEIKITSILQRTISSFDIRWQELIRDIDGNLINIDHLLATVSYQYTSPSQDQLILKHNPLGFYITQFSLTKES